MTHTTITWAIHDHLDPACRYFRGVRAWWGFRWLFRCDECRAKENADG
jgi:hypothetical protein